MQSILLVTPSKASKLETSNENKISADAISSQGKTEEGKNATEFASILEQTVSEKKEAKSNVSTSELLSKEISNKKDNEVPLLAEKNEQSESSAKANKVDVNSIPSNEKTAIEGKSQESLKVEPSIGQAKLTGDELIDTDVDDNTANKKSINESLTEPISDDKTKVAKSDAGVTQLQSTQENLKNDALPLEKQVQQNNDFLSAIATPENVNLEESESDELVQEDKQADVLSISNEALSDNAKGISLEKETKLTKEQNTAHFSKEVSQADSEIMKAIDLVEASPATPSDVDVIEESTEVGVSALAEESNKQNFTEQLSPLENNNIEDDKALNVKLDDPQVLSTASVNKLSDEIIEEQNSIDSVNKPLNEISDEQNSTNSVNKSSDEMFEEQNSTDPVNNFSDETMEEQNTDAVIANINALNPEVRVTKESNSNKADEQEISEDEQALIYSTSESDQEVSEQVINPILAQIQAAQKTDTKVTDNKIQTLGINNIDKDSKKGDKASAQDAAKSLLKSNTSNIENVLADNELESMTTEKDLINKANISANEKIEGMLANLKAETIKPIFNQNTDSHSINTLGVATASADKLLNQTQASITNSTLQSTALQQPIELQSKQAAAMVGERIMMMINQGKQEVNIRLDPAELGSMHIKLQVQQEQVQVAIQTQVGQSRDIIEQNLPRLREQLAQQGINLGEASVEQQSKQNQGNSQGSSQMAGSAQGTNNLGDGFVDEQNEFFPTQITLPAQGIDYYA